MTGQIPVLSLSLSTPIFLPHSTAMNTFRKRTRDSLRSTRYSECAHKPGGESFHAPQIRCLCLVIGLRSMAVLAELCTRQAGRQTKKSKNYECSVRVCSWLSHDASATKPLPPETRTITRVPSGEKALPLLFLCVVIALVILRSAPCSCVSGSF